MVNAATMVKLITDNFLFIDNSCFSGSYTAVMTLKQLLLSVLLKIHKKTPADCSAGVHKKSITDYFSISLRIASVVAQFFTTI